MIKSRVALLVVLAAASLTLNSARAQGQQSYTKTTETTVGPAQVVDSWMQPTVVRSTKTVTGDGKQTESVAPIVQEREERVVIPSSQTVSTTSVIEKPAVTRTASNRSYQPHNGQTAHRTTRHVALSHPRHMAFRASTQSSTSGTSTEVQTTERSTSTQTIMDRRDPALDLH